MHEVHEWTRKRIVAKKNDGITKATANYTISYGCPSKRSMTGEQLCLITTLARRNQVRKKCLKEKANICS